MKFILKFLIGILNLIFAVFKLLPVGNKVTFISRQANEKTEDMELLEKQLAEKTPELKLVFLCKKLEGGLASKLAYCFHLLSQMYHIATSKVVVLDSYCIGVSALKQRHSLVVIQMWHALGSLKKFGLSIVGEGEGRNKEVAEAMGMHKNYTYVLTSGEACAPNFGEAFGCADDKLRVMSLPRVDKLTDPVVAEGTRKRVYDRYPEFPQKKVVVYAPTFRAGRDISAETEALAKQFDAEEFDFVVKKHPLMEIECKSGIVDREFSTLEMLFAADYVICDYSAVVFEAAILKKPLFFYTFDYDSYGVDRDFYIDYMKEMPGFISKNSAELAEAVRQERYDLTRVEAFSHKFVKYQQGCSEKLAEFIIENCK